MDRTCSLRGCFPRDTNFQIMMVERACSLRGHVLEETKFSKKQNPFIKIKTPFIKIKAFSRVFFSVPVLVPCRSVSVVPAIVNLCL